MSKARFPIGQRTTSYDGCCGVLFRERKGDVYCITLHYSRSFSVVESLLPPSLWFLHEFSESSGRRPDSRLGRRGKKLGDCGIVGLWDCGEIAISEISGFFHVFPYLKNCQNFTFQRSFGLAPEIRIFWFPAPNQRGGPLKSEILAIFQKRKNMKNPEISEIAIFAKSLNP